MNLRTWVAAGVAAGLFGLGGASLAQTNGQSGEGSPGGTMTLERNTTVSPSDVRQLRLKVKDVDKANHKVTFEAQVSPEANLEENGQPITLDQLQQGDEVRASFVPSTGEVIRLQVTRTGAQGQQQNK